MVHEEELTIFALYHLRFYASELFMPRKEGIVQGAAVRKSDGGCAGQVRTEVGFAVCPLPRTGAASRSAVDRRPFLPRQVISTAFQARCPRQVHGVGACRVSSVDARGGGNRTWTR